MASTERSVLLVCEFFVDGSLQDRLERLRKSKAPRPEPLDLVQQLQQIASGLEYLHALEPPVLHRDLKSANILLGDAGSRLAIADFGLARYQAGPGSKMTAETGSYRWMAPEVIRHEEYNAKCDVYSFAITAWEMLTYRIPFDNLMPVEAAFGVAREAKRPPVPPETPASIKQMLSACWNQDARLRPALPEICMALSEEVTMLIDGQGSLPAAAADLAVGDPA
jgi:serine/threonine protein kinase